MDYRVFTPEWVAKINQRYERHLDYERPTIYFVATASHNQKIRAEIEESLELLPESCHSRLIPNLRSKMQWRDTYHELVVGTQLIKLGFSVEYERSIGKRTPDWYVHPKGNIPAFAVEVFMVNPPEEEQRAEAQWRRLLARLREVPIGAVVAITPPHRGALPDDQQSEAIVKEVYDWLANGSIQPGDLRKIDGIKFTVHEIDERWQKLNYVATSPSGGFVSTAPLKERIKNKVSKYNGPLSDLGIPLVLAVAADFFTSLGKDDLDEVLGGSVATQFFVNHTTGDVVEGNTFRQNDGLLRSIDPILSVVLWIEKGIQGWALQPVFNPYAMYPLPPNTFE